MPVTLVVDALAPLTFDAPRIVLGRGAQCDVRLPDASVSARHASIRAHHSGWVVVDEASTNGTKLNGERLAAQAPRPLRTGDVLLLGRVEVQVRLGAAVPTTAHATRELALALVARQLGDPAASIVTVRVSTGADAGKSVALPLGQPRTIGRDPRCALRLTDKGIPPIALEVVFDGTRTKVTRRDPRVPARLGGREVDVGPPSWWNEGGLLEIASTTLTLDDPLARALDASAQGDDERVIAAAPASATDAPTEPEPESPIAPPSAAEVIDARPPRAEPVPRSRAVERRRSWRGATVAFEIVALILGLLVLGGSAAGLWWLLRK
ncbi:MAG: FHA domain-containing protein [Polyangiales bacterium]